MSEDKFSSVPEDVKNNINPQHMTKMRALLEITKERMNIITKLMNNPSTNKEENYEQKQI